MTLVVIVIMAIIVSNESLVMHALVSSGMNFCLADSALRSMSARDEWSHLS